MRGPTPNPGSPEAVALGCRCPVLYNNHGNGAYVNDNYAPDAQEIA